MFFVYQHLWKESDLMDISIIVLCVFAAFAAIFLTALAIVSLVEYREFKGFLGFLAVSAAFSLVCFSSGSYLLETGNKNHLKRKEAFISRCQGVIAETISGDLICIPPQPEKE
jgi:hypothetical protein